jgi:hypothetical protein
MGNKPKTRILPMKTAGTQHFVERTYRESGTFQWARETYKNAEEAGATRIEFGLEWQAVESLGVYRRVIADNGRGMSPEELVEFFNTFGGGGKPIGGLHENYGVGAKTSLLPWNRYGMVVISWVDGEPAMIWVQHDTATGEYGLRLEEVDDDDTGETSLDEVYGPYDDPEHGCDWAAVKPAWIGDHGTVIVLLGNDPSDDTALGDPSRTESDIKGLSTYLNRRIWKIRDGLELYVDELRTQDRSQWPQSEEMAHEAHTGRGPDRRTNLRHIRGARFYIRYPVRTFAGGKLAASDTVDLPDGTKIGWYLWDGERPAVHSYASRGGYIAALYDNELYDVTQHQATYRSFGITEREVRSRVWLIIRPPLADQGNGHHGVYPRTDRNSLLIKGGPAAGDPLPINDWAADFATRMPDELVDAIQKARTTGGGTITDTAWKERLADRFGARWRIPKLRARPGGSHSVDPAQVGGKSLRGKVVKKRKKGTRGGSGGQAGGASVGSSPGATPAVRTRVAGGLPNFRPVRAGDGVSPEMLAAWSPNDPTEPAGVVLINVDHPVLRAEIEHWQAQFADHLAQEIGDEVIKVYGEQAVAKVAHSEHLKGLIPSKDVEDKLRSEAALTMALLGLMGEEAILAPRIGGKFRKRKIAA